MRVGTLLLANAFLLAAMLVAYRDRTRRRRADTGPADTRLGRTLLAGALACFAVHLVLLGVEGV